ncbi:hypothetical protein FGO68_gene17706 [Halteria grandinella]|uniref:Uncharacterized protein n=1 Tax=Halteria grandinella TaxID=5974 RepID=A0A8J8SUF0_HALGN|nr:hypothetical protein FGO68_gene17706 [Halteria grandinella]
MIQVICDLYINKTPLYYYQFSLPKSLCTPLTPSDFKQLLWDLSRPYFCLNSLIHLPSQLNSDNSIESKISHQKRIIRADLKLSSPARTYQCTIFGNGIFHMVHVVSYQDALERCSECRLVVEIQDKTFQMMPLDAKKNVIYNILSYKED